jgi:hypothetical protein
MALRSQPQRPIRATGFDVVICPLFSQGRGTFQYDAAGQPNPTVLGTPTAPNVISKLGIGRTIHPTGGANGATEIYYPSSAFSPSSDFTALWVGTILGGVTYSPTIWAGYQGGSDAVRLLYTSSTNLRFSWIDSSPAQYNLDLTVPALSSTTPIALAVKKIGTTRSVFYLDGKLTASQTSGLATARSDTRGFLVGAVSHNVVTHFSVHRRALPNSVIFELLQNPWAIYTVPRVWVQLGPAASSNQEKLITLNNGEIETLTDNDIIAPSSLGTGAAANTFLAGDGTYKSLGTLDGSVGTILNKYNYGGL